MATLTIFVPDQDPMKFNLEGQPQVTVGRSPDMDIILDHASISSSHAVLKLVGDAYHLQDLGSTNGTFVEGEGISEVQLVNGSKITFGTLQADYESAEVAPVEEQPAADAGVSADEFEDGGGYAAGPDGRVAETSVRPAGYNDLSPIEKVEKKDTVGMVALLIGTLAIIAAVGLVVMSAMMTAA